MCISCLATNSYILEQLVIVGSGPEVQMAVEML